MHGQLLIQLVDPRAAGIDQHVRLQAKALTAQRIFQQHRLVASADHPQIIERQRLRAGAFRIFNQLKPESLRRADPRIVVAGAVFHPGREARPAIARGGFVTQLVARHSAILSRVEVVQAQAGFDQQRAAPGGLIAQAQETSRGVNQSTAEIIDRYGGTQRKHIVRGVFQQAIALHHRLLHQAKLAGLQIAQAAVNHARQRAAGRLAPVTFLHQHRRNAL